MLPKEHGGTVMLAASLAAGALVAGGASLSLLALVLAAGAAHLLREPVVELARYRERLPAATRRSDRRQIAACAVAALLGGALLAARLPLLDLAIVVLPAVVLGAVVVILGARRKARSLGTEILGTAAACLAAPAAVLTVDGRLGAPALTAFVACLVFFEGAMLHLRALVRRRRAKRTGTRTGVAPAWFSVASVAVAVALWPLGAAMHPVAIAMPVALVRPVVLRGRVLEAPKRIGIAETLIASVFVVVLAVAVIQVAR